MRLVSDSFRRQNPSGGQLNEYDLLAAGNSADTIQGGYNFDPQAEPFKSGVFQLQVDRFGLRMAVEKDLIFRGILGTKMFVGTSATTIPDDYIRVSELDLSSAYIINPPTLTPLKDIPNN